jgi:hypothetical protein
MRLAAVSCPRGVKTVCQDSAMHWTSCSGHDKLAAKSKNGLGRAQDAEGAGAQKS